MSIDPHLAPHWDSAALVTIDMQRDFLSDGAFGVPGTSEILPALTELVTAFRASGRLIVHIVRLHQGGDVDRLRRTLIAGGADFVRPGSAGRLLAKEIADVELADDLLLSGRPQPIGPAEIVLYKPRWGAFYRTDLEALLAGRSTLVFAGCNLPNCSRASIVEAHERDFRVVLATDAVSQAGEQGLREVAALGTTLMRTPEIVAAITATPPEAGVHDAGVMPTAVATTPDR
jgi:nicotinamidase-related amidase